MIHWPGSNGGRITQTVANVAVGQKITIHETMPATGVESPADLVGRLLASPNPASTSISFAVRGNEALGLDARIEIRDVGGRKVRDLSLARSGSTGLLPATWDGIDAEGHRAPPGVYFARVLGTRNLEPVRVVVLR